MSEFEDRIKFEHDKQSSLDAQQLGIGVADYLRRTRVAAQLSRYLPQGVIAHYGMARKKEWAEKDFAEVIWEGSKMFPQLKKLHTPRNKSMEQNVTDLEISILSKHGFTLQRVENEQDGNSFFRALELQLTGKLGTGHKDKKHKPPAGTIGHGDLIEGDGLELLEFVPVPSGKERETILDCFGKYVSAFRNSNTGGAIWFGVSSLGAVEGFVLNDDNKTKLEQSIHELLTKHFDPELTDADCALKFHEVHKLSAQSSRSLDKYVLRVTVKPLWKEDPKNCQEFKGEAYKKSNGEIKPMTSREVKDRIKGLQSTENKGADESSRDREKAKFHFILRQNICNAYLFYYAGLKTQFKNQVEIENLLTVHDVVPYVEELRALNFPAEFADILQACKRYAVDIFLWIPGYPRPFLFRNHPDRGLTEQCLHLACLFCEPFTDQTRRRNIVFASVRWKPPTEQTELPQAAPLSGKAPTSAETKVHSPTIPTKKQMAPAAAKASIPPTPPTKQPMTPAAAKASSPTIPTKKQMAPAVTKASSPTPPTKKQKTPAPAEAKKVTPQVKTVQTLLRPLSRQPPSVWMPVTQTQQSPHERAELPRQPTPMANARTHQTTPAAKTKPQTQSVPQEAVRNERTERLSQVASPAAAAATTTTTAAARNAKQPTAPASPPPPLTVNQPQPQPEPEDEVIVLKRKRDPKPIASRDPRRPKTF